MATEFTVGDDSGWTINFDYNAWATDKVFRVGDNLGNVLAQTVNLGIFDSNFWKLFFALKNNDNKGKH